MIIVSSDQIDQSKKTAVGSKAFNLVQLIDFGFTVPSFFVIQLDSGEEVSKYWDEILKQFDTLRSDEVSVRSSSSVEDSKNYSFAGLFDTYLHVTRDQVIEKIEACFAAVRNQRVEEYCRVNGIDVDLVKMAVIVQTMISAEYSGVCFTKNSVTNNKREIMIEVAQGDGENVVAGIVTPDNFVIQKNDLTFTNESANLPESKTVAQQVSSIAKEIEHKFGYFADIEWCFKDGVVFVLQVRPITS